LEKHFKNFTYRVAKGGKEGNSQKGLGLGNYFSGPKFRTFGLIYLFKKIRFPGLERFGLPTFVGTLGTWGGNYFGQGFIEFGARRHLRC